MAQTQLVKEGNSAFTFDCGSVAYKALSAGGFIKYIFCYQTSYLCDISYMLLIYGLGPHCIISTAFQGANRCTLKRVSKPV